MVGDGLDDACGTTASGVVVADVRLRRDLLERLATKSALRSGCEQEHSVRVPPRWLEFLRPDGIEFLKPQVAVQPVLVAASQVAPPAAAKQDVVPTVSFASATSWLAKLGVETTFAKTLEDATQHHAKPVSAERMAVVRARSKQEFDSHCKASVEFLRGPRRVRDQFGSIAHATDRTADIILQARAELNDEMISGVADFCRQSRGARTWGDDAQHDDNDADGSLARVNIIRMQAAHAIEESDRLLARCKNRGHDFEDAGSDIDGQQGRDAIQCAATTSDPAADCTFQTRSEQSTSLTDLEARWLQRLRGLSDLCDSHAERCAKIAANAAGELERSGGSATTSAHSTCRERLDQQVRERPCTSSITRTGLFLADFELSSGGSRGNGEVMDEAVSESEVPDGSPNGDVVREAAVAAIRESDTLLARARARGVYVADGQ